MTEDLEIIVLKTEVVHAVSDDIYLILILRVFLSCGKPKHDAKE